MAGGCRPRLFDRDAIRELYRQEGQTGVTVARHFGCSRTVVYDACADIKKPYQKEQVWSEEQIAQLRRLWGTMSSRQVADIMGRGKNAIVGKAHRLGLPNLGNPVTRSAEPRTNVIRLPKVVRKIEAVEPLLPFTTPSPPPNVQPRAVPTDAPESLRVPFAELFSDPMKKRCQWFTGPITRHYADRAACCGHEVAEKSAYCPFHTEKAADKRKTDESREAA